MTVLTIGEVVGKSVVQQVQQKYLFCLLVSELSASLSCLRHQGCCLARTVLVYLLRCSTVVNSIHKTSQWINWNSTIPVRVQFVSQPFSPLDIDISGMPQPTNVTTNYHSMLTVQQTSTTAHLSGIKAGYETANTMVIRSDNPDSSPMWFGLFVDQVRYLQNQIKILPCDQETTIKSPRQY